MKNITIIIITCTYLHTAITFNYISVSTMHIYKYCIMMKLPMEMTQQWCNQLVKTSNYSESVSGYRDIY